MLRELQRRLSAHQADLAAMGSLPPPDPEAAYRPDLLARMVLTLCPRLDPALSLLLEQLISYPPEALQLIRSNLAPELQAVLEVLEPIEQGLVGAAVVKAVAPVRGTEPVGSPAPVASGHTSQRIAWPINASTRSTADVHSWGVTAPARPPPEPSVAGASRQPWPTCDGGRMLQVLRRGGAQI